MADYALYKPDYPVMLTKGNWDKKKGTIAKMAGETGIGAQMAKVKALYDGVNWEAFDVAWQAIKYSGAAYSDDWVDKKAKEAAAAYGSGPVRKMVDEAYKLRDLCKETQKKFAANKLIPKSDTKLVADIAVEADQFGVANNAATYKAKIEAQIKIADKWYNDRMKANAGPAVNILKTALKKTPAAIKELRGDIDSGTAQNLLKKAARDLTQNLLNIEKGVKAGVSYPVETKRLIEIGHLMVKWGNNDHIFANGADHATIKKEVDAFEHLAREIAGILS